jgi:hypothetical protein
MKKITFYTLWNKDGKPTAIKVKGYTDGVYNYYKDNFGLWHTIVEKYGLSFPGYYTTRKACIDAAYSEKMQRELYKFINEKNIVELMDRYTRLVKKALNEV